MRNKWWILAGLLTMLLMLTGGLAYAATNGTSTSPAPAVGRLAAAVSAAAHSQHPAQARAGYYKHHGNQWQRCGHRGYRQHGQSCGRHHAYRQHGRNHGYQHHRCGNQGRGYSYRHNGGQHHGRLGSPAPQLPSVGRPPGRRPARLLPRPLVIGAPH